MADKVRIGFDSMTLAETVAVQEAVDKTWGVIASEVLTGRADAKAMMHIVHQHLLRDDPEATLEQAGSVKWELLDTEAD